MKITWLQRQLERRYPNYRRREYRPLDKHCTNNKYSILIVHSILSGLRRRKNE